MHCSDFKDNEESLGYSMENQVITLNIDDYNVIITDNELPDIYGLIDKEKDHKGVQKHDVNHCSPCETVGGIMISKMNFTCLSGAHNFSKYKGTLKQRDRGIKAQVGILT